MRKSLLILASLFVVGSAGTALAQSDYLLSATPIGDGPIEFKLSACDQTQTRPLVIKNNTDEPISGIIASQNAKIELGNKVAEMPYLNLAFAENYVYAMNLMNNAIIKLNASTWEEEKSIKPNESVYSIAYDGKTLWASTESGKIVAYDANLNPTGASFETGYDGQLIVYSGTELLAIVFDEANNEVRVIAIDTKGQKTADYGTLPQDGVGEMCTFDPKTQTLWFVGSENLYAYNLSHGKFVNSARLPMKLSTMNIVAGFDNNGNVYVLSVNFSTMDMSFYADSKIRLFSAGFTASHTYIDLQPGEQTTINITADASHGSSSTQIEAYNPDEDITYFKRTLISNLDVEAEYVTSHTTFTAFKDFSCTDTVWFKNTGCKQIIMNYEPILTSGTVFTKKGIVIPGAGTGVLYNNDSIGCIVSFNPTSVGEFTDILKVRANGTAFEVELTGTSKALNYTIADNNPSATITNCGPLTVTDQITNGNNVPMIISKETHTIFTIHASYWASEMSWKLYNADGSVIKESKTYSRNTVYTESFVLPEGSYTLYMYDSYGDGWDDGAGYIDITGNVNLSGATVTGSQAQVSFTINPWSTTIAANSSITGFDITPNKLDPSGTTNLYVFIEGFEESLEAITLTTTGSGQPELAVADAINLGGLYPDQTNSIVIPVTNSGCAPLTVTALQLTGGENNNMMFWDSENEILSSSLSFDKVIEPNQTVEFTLAARPYGAINTEVTDVMNVVTTAGTAQIQLKSVNIGLPVAELLYGQYDSEIKDTIPCSHSGAVTIKNSIKNSGTGTLKVSEPMEIRYQAGTTGTCYCYLYDADGHSIGNTYYCSSFDINRFYTSIEGDYRIKISNYRCDGTISVISNGKTLLTINLADDNDGNYYFTLNAADIATHSIAAGASKELQMSVYPDPTSVTSDQTFSYTLLTNDANNTELTMYGKVRVVRAPSLVFPETIDFGEVTQGLYESAYLRYENIGCGDISGYKNVWIVETGTPFEYYPEAGGDLWFEPTGEPGDYTATLKVATYYYVLSEEVKDTFEITLKGKCVAAPALVFDGETINVTAEPGAETVTATATIGNNGQGTLILTDATKAFLYGNAGTGPNASKIYWSLDRKTETGSWTTVKYVNSGTYTAAGQLIDVNNISLPAGEYRLVMDCDDNYVYGWNGGYLAIETDDGIQLLNETRVASTSNRTTARFNVTERQKITVAAGAQTNIDIVIPIKGLSSGSYTFYREYNTNDAATVKIQVNVTINDSYAYDLNKTKAVFEPVHIGATSYASVTLRNRGTVPLGISGYSYKESSPKFQIYDVIGSEAPGDSITVKLKFTGDEAKLYRDTLYIAHGTEKPDTIALEATATLTRVIAVSPVEPNGFYRVGDTININVVFDMPILLNGGANDTMLMLLNTGKFAKLYYDENSTDNYALTFRYGVEKNDNVAALDYKEDTIYRNGRYLLELNDPTSSINSIVLPKVGTFASAYAIALDNKAPVLTDTAFNLNIADMQLEVKVKFNEPVSGFNEKSFRFEGGASLKSFNTKDNQTYSAVIGLESCKDIDVSINATIADRAGNTKKVNESKKIPAFHVYTPSVVAPTCTEEGCTLLVCSVCKHEEKTNVVAATGHVPGEPTIEVKVAATETAAGKCDTVVYCTVCHAELSRTEGVIPQLQTAIAENEAAVAIYAIGQTVIVEVAEPNGDEIIVVDVNGRVVAKVQANSTRTEITLPTAGIYMVSVGQTTEKVVLQ